MSRVMVDFDGVIHSYVSGWTGPVPTDPPTRGAQRFITSLQALGVDVVIFTTRAHSPEGYQGTVDWLTRYGFPVLPVTDTKMAAMAYVDDRAVVCRPTAVGGPGFAASLHRVKKLLG